MGTKITFHVYDSGICFPLSLFKLAFRLSIQRRDTAGRLLISWPTTTTSPFFSLEARNNGNLNQSSLVSVWAPEMNSNRGGHFMMFQRVTDPAFASD